MPRESSSKPNSAATSNLQVPSLHARTVLAVILSGLLAAAVVLPVQQFLFMLLGDDLASLFKTSFFDLVFRYGTYLIMGFMIGVVLGWFTKEKGLLIGALAGLAAVLLESAARYIRLHEIFSAKAVITAAISPKLFLFTYALLLAGFIFGALVGNKAFRENHRTRLYVFAAFLGIMLLSTQLFFLRSGFEVFNPLSKLRGVL